MRPGWGGKNENLRDKLMYWGGTTENSRRHDLTNEFTRKNSGNASCLGSSSFQLTSFVSFSLALHYLTSPLGFCVAAFVIFFL